MYDDDPNFFDPFTASFNDWGEALVLASLLGGSSLFMGAMLFFGWWEIFE